MLVNEVRINENKKLYLFIHLVREKDLDWEAKIIQVLQLQKCINNAQSF